jgi:hypothetical protein
VHRNGRKNERAKLDSLTRNRYFRIALTTTTILSHKLTSRSTLLLVSLFKVLLCLPLAMSFVLSYLKPTSLRASSTASRRLLVNSTTPKCNFWSTPEKPQSAPPPEQVAPVSTDTVTTTDLIKHVAKEHNLSQAESRRVVGTVFDLIMEVSSLRALRLSIKCSFVKQLAHLKLFTFCRHTESRREEDCSNRWLWKLLFRTFHCHKGSKSTHGRSDRHSLQGASQVPTVQ